MNYDTTTTEGKANVMLAHANGEKIQTRRHDGDDAWQYTASPLWNWYQHDYRIKPKEPRRWWINPAANGLCSCFDKPTPGCVEVVEVLK